MAIPTATSNGASCPLVVDIATVGAVVYALPVVVNATEEASIDVPARPIVAVAPNDPVGGENVTGGTVV